jgi:hypothetical protein
MQVLTGVEEVVCLDALRQLVGCTRIIEVTGPRDRSWLLADDGCAGSDQPPLSKGDIYQTPSEYPLGILVNEETDTRRDSTAAHSRRDHKASVMFFDVKPGNRTRWRITPELLPDLVRLDQTNRFFGRDNWPSRLARRNDEFEIGVRGLERSQRTDHRVELVI